MCAICSIFNVWCKHHCLSEINMQQNSAWLGSDDTMYNELSSKRIKKALERQNTLNASIDWSVMHQKNAKKIPAEGVASQNFRQKKGRHVSGCQVSQKFFSCRKPLLKACRLQQLMKKYCDDNDPYYNHYDYYQHAKRSSNKYICRLLIIDKRSSLNKNNSMKTPLLSRQHQ